LRLRQSEYLYRKVLDDIPVERFVIPKGWLLRVCIRESHRDARIFANPHTFDPDRFLDARHTREEYATFGASRVSCLGEHLVLMLGRIFVEEFATTVETLKLADGPLEYRRWHWKPSSRWRVRVSRLDGETPTHHGSARRSAHN
jgi:cytochrome P450